MYVLSGKHNIMTTVIDMPMWTGERPRPQLVRVGEIATPRKKHTNWWLVNIESIDKQESLLIHGIAVRLSVHYLSIKINYIA